MPPHERLALGHHVRAVDFTRPRPFFLCTKPTRRIVRRKLVSFVRCRDRHAPVVLPAEFADRAIGHLAHDPPQHVEIDRTGASPRPSAGERARRSPDTVPPIAATSGTRCRRPAPARGIRLRRRCTRGRPVAERNVVWFSHDDIEVQFLRQLKCFPGLDCRASLNEFQLGV